MAIDRLRIHLNKAAEGLLRSSRFVLQVLRTAQQQPGLSEIRMLLYQPSNERNGVGGESCHQIILCALAQAPSSGSPGQYFILERNRARRIRRNCCSATVRTFDCVGIAYPPVW